MPDKRKIEMVAEGTEEEEKKMTSALESGQVLQPAKLCQFSCYCALAITRVRLYLSGGLAPHAHITANDDGQRDGATARKQLAAGLKFEPSSCGISIAQAWPRCKRTLGNQRR